MNKRELKLMNLTKVSRYLSYILRHHPEAANVQLDRHGWADVRTLLTGMSQKYPMTMEILEEIVRTDEKGRYAFNEDKSKIRARQGHSVFVDVELKPLDPPEYLYHGTATRFMAVIDKEGLKPMSRLYVHLSKDEQTAYLVGKRHGKPLIYRVQSQKMAQAGFEFYISENGIWLTKYIPVQYLEKIASGQD